MKKYVIIGNGTAAAGCIEGIRSVDKKNPITVISAEKHPVYCRPLISYYLEEKTDLAHMKYRLDDFYEKNGCTILYGKSAKHIDSKKKQVILDNGDIENYSTLCIAAGSTPFVPPMEGLDGVSEKYVFMTLDDALAIEKAVNHESRVLIIGAGLIGLKCAEGLHNRVGSITVCELADRVLSSILDNESSAIVQRRLENNGIKFLLNDSVTKFECHADAVISKPKLAPQGSPNLIAEQKSSLQASAKKAAGNGACGERLPGNTAFMKSGVQVEFDVLILGVGVRANTSLIREIGGNSGRGITIDGRMRTSIPDIYAAGDCTESVDISDGTVKVMALLPNAYMQGYCAGTNMAGGEGSFDNAIPMNSIGLFGLHMMTAGSRFSEEAGGKVYEEKAEGRIKKLFMKDGRLTGFELVGGVDRAGIYTNMIRTRMPIDSINFESLSKNPSMLAFDANYRRNSLGGMV